ncbi:hypothetical protein ABMA70_05515 [Halobacteriovorax sp. XZX-3]|uniref:hypothetical protein n=1 Tax=unclassified Halobacteriovorax TaxID=2639665 RepID=UPI000CCFF55A|nr:hypothetical protein [Halobacteriovorax sp. DA5]POB15045.1 hypothetical protein C0Z22_01320 [Halobacteriovorax sp. DA5]
MKLLLAMAVIACLGINMNVSATEILKSIPVEDQGPEKDEKDSKKEGDSKKTKEDKLLQIASR